ncbi:hypothetical protein BDN67DRAFT_1000775 [Paxillus ammoniavirescens]|nr:hypothetical protein BDN67DRAFT_1000775 [Paxillus ammoniavirescens]
MGRKFLRSIAFWALLCTSLSGLPATLAQESNATCQPSFTWADNSLGQSPCIVASYLESQCFTNGFNIQGLNPGQYYGAPSGAYANPCECNTVAYSLVSACGACQGAVYLTWPAWTVNCNATLDRYSVLIFLLPDTLRVNSPVSRKHLRPVQLFLRGRFLASVSVESSRFVTEVTFHYLVQVNDTWDGNAAYINASTTSSTTTTTTTTPSPSLVQTTTSSPQVASPSSTTESSRATTNVGAIAGGVIGGVALLAVAGVVIFCVGKRYRGTKKNSSDQLPDISQSVPPYAFSGQPVGYQAPAAPQKLYNPDDPSTFPIPRSLEPSAMVTTTHTAPSMSSIHRPGAYTGAPEV